MKIVIDVVLLVIIALCTWSGYKKGLIGGIAGLLAIIIALFGGSLLSGAFSAEVIPALRPFVDGYVSSQDSRDAVLEKLGYGESDYSLNDILAADPSLKYDYAYECMRIIGFYDDRAEELAEKTVKLAAEGNESIQDAVVDVQCDTVTYVAGISIGFIMILILLIGIANFFNLSMRLPNMENLDEIGGAVLGFVKGMLYCILLCWLLSFLGFVIGRETLGGTTLGKFFLIFKFITGSLI